MYPFQSGKKIPGLAHIFHPLKQPDIKNTDQLRHYLDHWSDYYNKPEFIRDDPVSVPHKFSGKQDVEISGFFAALFAWGQRKTTLNKSEQLLELMEYSPYAFVQNHKEPDLARLQHFRHRTFNGTDIIFLVQFLQKHYEKYESLEEAFIPESSAAGELSPFEMFKTFHDYVFSYPEYPGRTQKHIATPAKNSSCKRLAMFLRWMVRNDRNGVDFGIWEKIRPAHLLCPLDVHVNRTARQLGLLERKQSDFKAATELTENLKTLDRHDPVKYDFALFGLSIAPV